jgi:hypothetical protein
VRFYDYEIVSPASQGTRSRIPLSKQCKRLADLKTTEKIKDSRVKRMLCTFWRVLENLKKQRLDRDVFLWVSITEFPYDNWYQVVFKYIV